MDSSSVVADDPVTNHIGEMGLSVAGHFDTERLEFVINLDDETVVLDHTVLSDCKGVLDVVVLLHEGTCW